MFAIRLIVAASIRLLAFVSAEQRNITAEPGQTVTLPCRAGDGRNITAVEWNRLYLEPDYVLLCRGGRCESDQQHSSFQQRVDLQDRQMKDGDVSMILKDVTINDTGIYECQVSRREKGKRLADTKIISIIHLEISPPGRTQDGGDMAAGRTQDGGDKGGGDEDGGDEDGGDEDGGEKDGGEKDAQSRGHHGLIGGVPAVMILVLVGGVGFWIFKKKNSAPPPHMISP